jgi:predicted aldo/keto reductase-like oxidoreductase
VTADQVRECCEAALLGPLPEGEQSVLQRQSDRIIDVIGSDYCRGCRHCLDDAPGFQCPQGIPFEKVLMLEARAKVARAAGLDVDHLKQIYADLPAAVSDCTQCGQCEARCIYRIPTVEMLQEAGASLGA